MTSSRSSCSCRRAPGLPKERGCRLGSANAGSGTALELSPGLRLGALVWPALSWAPGSAVAAGPAAAGLRCNACICAAHCSQPRLLCCIVEMFRAEVWMTPWFHAAAASAWAAHLPRRHACSAQPAPPRTEATPAALALEQAPGGTDGYSQRPPRGTCTQQVWRRARPACAAGVLHTRWTQQALEHGLRPTLSRATAAACSAEVVQLWGIWLRGVQAGGAADAQRRAQRTRPPLRGTRERLTGALRRRARRPSPAQPHA